MESKDLMLGDWVDVNGLPSQVFELAYNKNEKEMTIGILDPQGEIYSCFEGYDHVAPIPLTDEILEKNGLVLEDEFGYSAFALHFMEDKNLDLELSKSESGFWCWSISCDEYCVVQLHYVHQLQHALRLCGIEKDIEL